MPDTTSLKVPDSSRVRIRMYRLGIGDCFLLTFNGAREPRHILIDCGILKGAPGGKNRIQEVADNIRTETDGTGKRGKLDALVVTHEHWDHVSGFYDAKAIFDHMDIGEIWLAWTEDPCNQQAQSLKRQNSLKLQAVHQALARLANYSGPQMRGYSQGVAKLLGFYGGPPEDLSLAAFSEKTAAAMAAVTQRSPAPAYFKPGEKLRRDWLPGVNIYVLGPPQELGMLKKMEGKAGKDTYGLTGADSAFAAALDAAAKGWPVDPGSSVHIDAALPFHPSLQWFEKNQQKFIKDPDFGTLYQEYNAKDADWRRIDQDWLLSMARLALQMDNAVNNTSLVLAFELGDQGQVLLFAADAQIGSWKSWLTLKWPLEEGKGRDKTFETGELLRRTVFYKVGHHGSHNATLKEGGLEAMTSPGLVAAIPVNEDFANNSKHWKMPALSLYERLKELTRGRILRADAAWPGRDEPLPEPLPQGLTPRDWARFTRSVSLDPNGLFIDYFVG